MKFRVLTTVSLQKYSPHFIQIVKSDYMRLQDLVEILLLDKHFRKHCFFFIRTQKGNFPWQVIHTKK